MLDGLRGEESIAELCRREGVASSMYYGWSKEFLEVGKRRLAGDIAHAASAKRPFAGPREFSPISRATPIAAPYPTRG